MSTFILIVVVLITLCLFCIIPRYLGISTRAKYVAYRISLEKAKRLDKEKKKELKEKRKKRKEGDKKFLQYIKELKS